MKSKIIVKLAVLVGLLVGNQLCTAVTWEWSVKNWTNRNVWAWGTYIACRTDHPKQVAKLGGVQRFNGHACLLTSVQGKDARTDIPSGPYTSKGQRSDREFHIIGPIDIDGRGTLRTLIGRFE